MSTATGRVEISPTQARNLPPSLRNEFYSLLLANTGICNIEASLTHELQRCGWLDDLKLYIRQLLRSGEATTVDQAIVKVREKMGLVDAGYPNGDFAAQPNLDAGMNGMNGVNGHGHDASSAKIDLTIPEHAKQRAAQAIRKELVSVCEVIDE